MADEPTITPNAYVDSDNAKLLQDVTSALNGQPLNSLTIAQLRAALETAQLDGPTVPHPDVEVSHFAIQTSHGDIKTFIFRPKGRGGNLPFVYHVHGGAFFFGNARGYTPFLSDLVARTGLAIVQPEYTLAPLRTFPVQQEQCVEVLEYLIQHGHEKRLAVDKVVILGDSAGGQLSAAVNIINQQKELNLPIVHQIMISPELTLNSLYGNFSEWVFQDGPFVTASLISESLGLYIPDAEDRKAITASPLLMTAQEAKAFMPSTTILVSQVDYLRDQGEKFAKLLQQAGVRCGVLQSVASLHAFVVFNQSGQSATADLVKTVIAGKVKEILIEGSQGNGVRNGAAVVKRETGLKDNRPTKRKRT